MPDKNRRFEDLTNGGTGIDPRVALGKLIAQVENLTQTTEQTSETVGKIADDVMEIKLQRATEDGRRKGIISTARLAEVGITVGTTLITTYLALHAAGATTAVPHAP